MKAAIAQLEISLETLVTNEPINRAEGNTEQADLEAVNASEIRQALAVLKAADAGSLYYGSQNNVEMAEYRKSEWHGAGCLFALRSVGSNHPFAGTGLDASCDGNRINHRERSYAEMANVGVQRMKPKKPSKQKRGRQLRSTGLLAAIDEERILQLSNDLSEDIASGTVKEWRTVAKYFRDELDKLNNRTAGLRGTLVALDIGEKMRAAALSEIGVWLKAANTKASEPSASER